MAVTAQEIERRRREALEKANERLQNRPDPSEPTEKAEALTGREKQQQEALARANERLQDRNPVVDQLTRFGQGANVTLNELTGGVFEGPARRHGFLPPEGEPEGVAAGAGRMVGWAPAMIPMIAWGSRAMQAPAAVQGTGVAEMMLAETTRTAVRSPGTFIAGEVAAGSAAGVGGVIAAQKFPDTPGARALGELVGGVTPAGITAAGRMAVQQVFTRLPFVNLFQSMTKQGARKRAGKRLERALGETAPGEAAQRMDRGDLIEGAPLTPAQRTREEGMLSLQRSVMEGSEALKAEHAGQIADLNAAVRSEVGEFSGASPQQARNYLEGLLNERLRIATARVDEQIAEMGGRATREDLNRLTRQELEAALRAARQQERELYQQIPTSATVQTTNATERFQRIRGELSKAEKGDIPFVANKLLDADNSTYIGDEASVKELRGLQSKLREAERMSRNAGKFNRARIANELANALTDDIADVAGPEEVVSAVKVATGFSKDLNDRFTRGEVGRLMGYAKEGGPAVPASVTLETTVGRGGPRAREATDALVEAVRRSGDEPTMRRHIQDFLMDDFHRNAVRDGEINPKAADRWLRSKQDVLSRFPEVRRQLERARESGEALFNARRFADPAESRAAVYIKAPPGQEIDRTLRTSDPEAAMQDLVSLARQDPSGKAVAGLKQAFMNRILRKSEIGAEDARDQLFVSGQRMAREMEDEATSQAMNGLFTDAERARIQAINNTALLMDRIRNARPAPEGVMDDAVGMVTSVMGRILGAQAGRVLAEQTGGGTVQTPGILAGLVQRMLRAGINDPARRLVNDAIQDEALFRAVMTDITTVPEQRRVAQRLNTWMLGVLADYQQELSDDAR